MGSRVPEVLSSLPLRTRLMPLFVLLASLPCQTPLGANSLNVLVSLVYHARRPHTWTKSSGQGYLPPSGQGITSWRKFKPCRSTACFVLSSVERRAQRRAPPPRDRPGRSPDVDSSLGQRHRPLEPPEADLCSSELEPGDRGQSRRRLNVQGQALSHVSQIAKSKQSRSKKRKKAKKKKKKKGKKRSKKRPAHGQFVKKMILLKTLLFAIYGKSKSALSFLS